MWDPSGQGALSMGLHPRPFSSPDHGTGGMASVLSVLQVEVILLDKPFS